MATGAALAIAVPVDAASAASASAAASGLPTADPTIRTLEVQGATPLSTARTIPHWHGQYTDPANGVTYGYNMVGADPAKNLDTTIQVDIVPFDFVFANGMSLNATDIIPNVLASPIFSATDFSHTPLVTSAADENGTVSLVPGGELSAGNTGVQYEDAIMRAQFNKIGTSFHLRLAPTVWPAVTIKVPNGNGRVFQSTRGVVWGEQNDNGGLLSSMAAYHLDPTHLWLFVANNVFIGHGDRWCCALGVHYGGSSIGRGQGDVGSHGNADVPTWMYATYLQPGTINPATAPFDTDINVFGHEISEWVDDPFDNNTVEPWYSSLPPQDGCYPILETGDPVDRIAFALPGNTVDGGPYADGYWHMQDEMFLPWVARQAPNTTSQPTQTPSANVGRYTFMGDLNPYPQFHEPAVGC